jgi:hypothetical protein
MLRSLWRKTPLSLLRLQVRSLVIAAMLTAVAATAHDRPYSTDTAFQVRYTSNIPPAGSTAIPDSVINITNTGARGGVTYQSGTSPTVGGTICVNVYAFTPDEQLNACCSCPVTPDGLVSMSVGQDIAGNVLIPRRPTSLVIKLLATVPAGGTCIGSMATVETATLAPGLAAWGTTAHPTGALGTGPWAITETPFKPATLSAGELTKLASECSYIVATYGRVTNPIANVLGLCACRPGGLGAGTSAN